MRKYKHILFDIDGTLIDTFFSNMDALVELFDKYRPGHGKSMKDFAHIFGIPGRQGLAALGFSPDEVNTLIHEWVAGVAKRADKMEVFANIIPVLAYLKKEGYQMAVVTSRTRNEDLGGPLGSYLPEPFRPYITHAICAGDTPRPKPYPDPLLHYMETTGAKREEVLFIGDAPTDLQAANAAGVDFALALWGYHGKKHLYCKHYLKNPWEIIGVVTSTEQASVCDNNASRALSRRLHEWAREINAIGQIGLAYTNDSFDKERFERLQQIASEIAHTYIDESVEAIKQEWSIRGGYKTPQIETRAAIFDDQDRILLVLEKNKNVWSLPGGWCDENLSLVENAVKEVREEACLDVHVKRLIAIQDRNRHNVPLHINGCLKAFVECSIGEGHFVENVETVERRFFTEDALPENLRLGTNTLEQVKMCFAAHRDPNWVTIVE